MFSLDTESTGLDHQHGARAFYVTVVLDDGEQRYYEWDVDPFTRAVDVPPSDLRELQNLIDVTANWGKVADEEMRERHKIVGHNLRFDLHTLHHLGIKNLPWGMIHDTLIASHLLASNQPHNLTDLAMHYLGVDIQPLEDDLHKACEEARRMCRTKAFHEDHGEVAIAREGRSDMPSAKEKCWKYDMWLPRALAKILQYEPDHPWWTLLMKYSNADSAVTMALWKRLEQELKSRDLWGIYLERLKVLPVSWEIENKGITVSKSRLSSLLSDFRAEESERETVCVNLADSVGYEIAMPKGSGINKSLKTFLFDHLKLPVVKWTDGGNPSFDKEVLNHYVLTLEDHSVERNFVKSLLIKRAYSTAISYLESYERFAISDPKDADKDIARLYSSHNPTGTDTLRASMNNPNGQQCSKGKELFPDVVIPSVRIAFGPPKGKEWWCPDYENIELRIPAYLSGEKAMIDLFEKPDDAPYFGSYHLLNASIIYPDLFWPLADKKGEFKRRYLTTWYQWAKNFGFCLQYGGGERTADRTAHRPGSFKAAKSGLKKMAELNERTIAFAERNGYVETIPDRTVNPRRGYPLLCTRSERGDVLPTVPLNFLVQGTACWVKTKAMTRCHEQIQEWRRTEKFQSRIVLECHDELDIEMPAWGWRNKEKVKEIKRIMESCGEDVGIPLKVSMSYHPKNWAEEVKISLE